MSKNEVLIIGGGLAGCEAAMQIASRKVKARIIEMRPNKMTPVHKTGNLAELVCSNSLKSTNPVTANGILHQEMRKLGSVVMKAADIAKVPAGQALAVDRELMSKKIEEMLLSTGYVEIERGEITSIPEETPCIIATGPMTSEELSKNLSELLGGDYLYFYDAVAPIVSTESIDKSLSFKASRYNKGEAEYLNCPLNKEEYDIFYNELINAEIVQDHHGFEQVFFEGCLPIEEIASRGYDTLRYGPMKPVGLKHPKTGKENYAVVQLRQENKEATMYSLVGFQTRLKWGEQKRVFSLIPALKNMEILRYGVMHRNIFINAPSSLSPTGETLVKKGLFIAGQLSGVEGYVESSASGILCGINAVRFLKGEELITFPKETGFGSLMNYITSAEPENFQPMSINMGLFPAIEKRFPSKKDKNTAIAQIAEDVFDEFIKTI